VNQRRIVFWAAGIVAVLVLAAFVGLQVVDSIAAREIASRGSAMTGTAVHVDDVDLSVISGSVTLRGLTVANPSGFTGANAFELGEVHVSLVPASLFGDLLMIHDIRIDAPRVFFEVNAAGLSNVEVIRQAVEAAAHRDKGEAPDTTTVPDTTPTAGAEPAATAPPTATPVPPAARSERRLIIETLAINDGELHFDATAAGGPQAAEKLPGFELTGIGARHGGATPAEAGRIVMAAVARDVAIAVAATQMQRYLGKELGGPLGEAIKKGGAEVIGKGLGELFDKMLGK
jgi:uncharacterized protein involved in outer membrane biogenesis